jgi:alpha-ketoglutarate-dependent taurine dioxygenase
MLDASVKQTLSDYAHTYMWERQLELGEMLVFSNQRLLHRRKVFEVTAGSAHHLTGCYANINETMNQY